MSGESFYDKMMEKKEVGGRRRGGSLPRGGRRREGGGRRLEGRGKKEEGEQGKDGETRDRGEREPGREAVGVGGSFQKCTTTIWFLDLPLPTCDFLWS